MPGGVTQRSSDRPQKRSSGQPSPGADARHGPALPIFALRLEPSATRTVALPSARERMHTRLHSQEHEKMATQQRNEEVLTAREHGRLIAADKVEGTPVVNPAGEKLGSIERIMIDKP